MSWGDNEGDNWYGLKIDLLVLIDEDKIIVPNEVVITN